MISPPVFIRLSKNKPFTMFTFETEVKRLRGPQNPNLGFAARISVLALPIGTERNGLGFPPFVCRTGRIQPNLSHNPHCHCLINLLCPFASDVHQHTS